MRLAEREARDEADDRNDGGGNSINTIYCGRRFLGCVPTAYVQIMNYWQWPAVIDNDTSEELNIPAEKYAGVNPISSYTPRIKAGTAMEWDGTESQYPFDVSDSSGVSSGAYDLRGHLTEKKRQCIGRACLLSQIISKASLKTTGAGWQDAYAFERYDQTVADWHTVTLPLSGMANGSVRFRLAVEKTARANAQWNDSAPVGYMMDDFTVTRSGEAKGFYKIQVSR